MYIYTPLGQGRTENQLAVAIRSEISEHKKAVNLFESPRDSNSISAGCSLDSSVKLLFLNCYFLTAVS